MFVSPELLRLTSSPAQINLMYPKSVTNSLTSCDIFMTSALSHAFYCMHYTTARPGRTHSVTRTAQRYGGNIFIWPESPKGRRHVNTKLNCVAYT
jgi:hypothetical protein